MIEDTVYDEGAPDLTEVPALSSDGADVEQKPEPVPTPAQKALADRWWKTVDDCPEFDASVLRWRTNLQALRPQAYTTDGKNANHRQTARSRTQDRVVETALITLHMRQLLTMISPPDTQIAFVPWTGWEQDPLSRGLGRTLSQLVERMHAEALWDLIRPAWAQAALCAPMAVLKMTFDRSPVDQAVSSVPEREDSQDQLARLKVLVQQRIDGQMSDGSADAQELDDLAQSVMGASEIAVWYGIRLELIPYDKVRIDPTIRSFEQAHRAAWWMHEVEKYGADCLAAYPFVENEDGSWSGILPKDRKTFEGAGDALVGTVSRPTRTSGAAISEENDPSLAGGSRNAKSTDTPFVVREIWSRRDNRVYVLIQGLSYPVASWVPKNPPAQWYPFFPLGFDPLPNVIHGTCTVEMACPAQNRINRKRTDEERARSANIPRLFASPQLFPDKDSSLRMQEQGGMQIIILPAETMDQPLDKLLKEWNPKIDLDLFNTMSDSTELREALSLPQASTGGVGGPVQFSSEIQAAVQGAATLTVQRQTIMRNAICRLAMAEAQVLIQNLTADEVTSICGPDAAATWPRFLSDQEAAQETKRLKVQAFVAGIAQGLVGVDEQTQEVSDPQGFIPKFVQDQCQQTYHSDEPLSREALFRRLRAVVNVGMDASLDRGQRIAGMKGLAETLSSLAQTAVLIGRGFDPNPVLAVSGSLFGADQSAGQVFPPLPPAPMPMLPPQSGLPPVPGDPGGRPPNQGPQLAALPPISPGIQDQMGAVKPVSPVPSAPGVSSA
ncbi:hypothetical protein MUP01_02215 [Candidatus Bathyarchaeota archaeon]|nr:hypothetical protein [Candidatus Bathyarchaeota archaeon]